MSQKNVLIFFNSNAAGGKSKKHMQAYTAVLAQNDIAFELYKSQTENNVENVSQLFAAHSFTHVAVIGGDGTLNLAINSLPNFDLPMHLIPAGTGNDLAKMVYEDTKPSYTYHKILTSTATKNIDVWTCNQRKFINVLGIGFDGKLIDQMQGKVWWISTRFKYWVEIMKQIFFYKSQSIRINGEPHTSFMCCISNGKVFGGDFNIAPNALADDKKLDLINVQKVNALQRLFYLPLLQQGKHLHLKVITHFQTDNLHIEAEEQLFAEIDGEPMKAKEFSIAYAGSLQFVC